MAISRIGREFDVACYPDETLNLECFEGGSEVGACPQAQHWDGWERDSRIREGDDQLRYYIPEGQCSRADGSPRTHLMPPMIRRGSLSRV